MVSLKLAMANNVIESNQSLITLERIVELKNIVKHDCGSCHGMSMRGGLGSPLTPDVISKLPKEYFVQIVLNGKPSTAMPPWKRFFSKQEAEWIVDYLREGIK